MDSLSPATIRDIRHQGACALREHRPELNGAYWKLNPYPEQSKEYALWLEGYDETAKRLFA